MAVATMVWSSADSRKTIATPHSVTRFSMSVNSAVLTVIASPNADSMES